MIYQILFKPSAAKDLAHLPKPIQKRIALKIESLATNPRSQDSKQLSGKDQIYRIRSGDYRILYQIQKKVVTVLIIRIGNRRDIYRGF